MLSPQAPERIANKLEMRFFSVFFLEKHEKKIDKLTHTHPIMDHWIHSGRHSEALV